jgi:lipopolysaccharide/colanic/teichoic acid biosynthesis glycosyltransferase
MTAPLTWSTPAGRRGEPLVVPRSKRLMDVVLAGAGLAVVWPLLVAIWLGVRLTSPGPAIFRQERLGLGARPFTLYKFRTMVTGAPDAVHRQYVTEQLTRQEAAGTGANGLYKLSEDPRVTPLGRWLRRTSLDELPQLVNVLRGEMSLVGPRPSLAWEAELYRNGDHRRFDVLPGITGLWQVSGRSRLTMRQALDLDVEYVRRRTLLLDLVILVRTVRCLLRVEAA